MGGNDVVDVVRTVDALVDKVKDLVGITVEATVIIVVSSGAVEATVGTFVVNTVDGKVLVICVGSVVAGLVVLGAVAVVEAGKDVMF